MVAISHGSLGKLLTVFLVTPFVRGQSSTSDTSQSNAVSATPTTSEASETIGTVTIDGSPSTYSVQFTVPASADVGADLLPNIYDSEAVDAQSVCPGYKLSKVEKNDHGFSATLTLAGEPCNVYGTDVDVLTLTVEYQSAERVNINIKPAYLVSVDNEYRKSQN